MKSAHLDQEAHPANPEWASANLEGLDPTQKVEKDEAPIVLPNDPTQREAASRAPEIEPEPPETEDRGVRGVVVDHLGYPVPGAFVQLQTQDPPDTFLNEFDIAEVGQLNDFDFELSQGTIIWIDEAATNEQGEFEFLNVNPERKVGLLYSAPSFRGPRFRHEMITGEQWAELILPDPKIHSSRVILNLQDQEGIPVTPERADFRRIQSVKNVVSPIGVTDASYYRGRVEGWLGIGTWEIVIAAQEGESRLETVKVTEVGKTIEVGVTLRTWPGSFVDRTEGRQLDPESKYPVVNDSRGLGRYIADRKRMPYAATSWDAHFAQTLRFGQGPVRAATLTMDLKAISGMSSNDALYLEFTGNPDKPFVYSTRIEKITGGRWSKPRRTRVHLDLANLPDGVNLLRELEDGLLDVIVQDDTAVLDLSLRIVR